MARFFIFVQVLGPESLYTVNSKNFKIGYLYRLPNHLDALNCVPNLPPTHGDFKLIKN